MDAGCWKDWNGLGEVTEVTALWGEGIGRKSHTLKLQGLGGFNHSQTELNGGPRVPATMLSHVHRAAMTTCTNPIAS